MNFNFQIAEYTALVGFPGESVPIRVTLTEELVGVWTLNIRAHWGTVVCWETFRSDDPLKYASEKLVELGYTPNLTEVGV